MAPHRPSHWILIALVILAAMFTLREVHGQTLHGDARATFEGRPSLAGAQGGLGAQAGLPQGGLGAQGNDAAIGLRLRKPSELDLSPNMPQGELDDPVVSQNNTDMVLRPTGDRRANDRDRGMARDQGSTGKNAAGSVRRQVQRVLNGSVASIR